MPIDHFVSRFLTKPWEVSDRNLWSYDFHVKTIRKVPSKELFSEVGLHSVAVGRRLNSIVESPLSAHVAALTHDNCGGAISIENWKLFRALVLLFPLQPIRLPNTAAPGSLEHILALQDSEIDFIAHRWSERYRLVRVRSSPSRPMFYPEAGYFLLPDLASHSIPKAVVAIPVTPDYAFAMVPIDSDIQSLRGLWTADLVSGLSVSLNSCRVVVPPELLTGSTDAAVGSGIEAERLAVVNLFSTVGDLKVAIHAFGSNDPETA